MKVTCEACKRRVRVKPNRDHVCRCGNILHPFPSGKFRQMLIEGDFDVIESLRKQFLNGSSIEAKRKIIDILTDFAGVEKTRIHALYTAVDILRSYHGTCYLDLARRMVRKWPWHFQLRYMYANCLDLKKDREAHLEALKQRIIGTSLQFKHGRTKRRMDRDRYVELMKRHLSFLYDVGRFLDGEEEYPTLRVMRIANGRRDPGAELDEMMRDLERISDVADLPELEKEDHCLRCVVDTNAISSPHAPGFLIDSDVCYFAPEEVLMELSRWSEVDRIPVELDRVRFKEVKMKTPPEIERMRARTKETEPSLADKKIATLALEMRADAIVSADRHIKDSGVDIDLEKNYGVGIRIVDPKRFITWIERNRDYKRGDNNGNIGMQGR